MANVYINNMYSANDASITGVSNVKFNYLSTKVYSATNVDRAYGIFISNILLANGSFVRWDNLSWKGESDLNSKIYLYARSAASVNELLSSEWNGPYISSDNDISWANGKYLQFMVVLKNDSGLSIFPIVNSINASFLSLNDTSYFFTKTFQVGFVPKQILLTYNATNITDDTILNFAVSGVDTIDPSYYKSITPNKIVDLYDLGFDSGQIKVMFELGGVSGTIVSVDELAFMISGDEETRINEMYMVSSSSSSLEYSSSSSLSSLEYSSSSSLSSFRYSSSSSTSNAHGIGYMIIEVNFIVG